MITSRLLENGIWKESGRYDLAVVGAGPAGIGAAIAAARQGLSVALIESYGFAGGVGTKSCVPLYFGFGVDGRQSTAGLSEEFIRRMDEAGAASLIINSGCVMPEFRPIAGRPLTAKVQLHPETMKLMYRRMLQEAGVECIFYAHMVDAVVEEGKICAVLVACLEGPVLISADYFVDATGDAHLFDAAGASMRKYSQEECMHKSMFFFVGGVTPFDHAYNCALYEQARAEGRLPKHVWDHFGYSVQLNPGVVQIAVCYGMGDALDSRNMTRMDLEMRETVFAVLDFLRREMPGFAGCYLLDTGAHIGVRAGRGIVGLETFTEEMVQQGVVTDEPVALTSRSYGAHSNDTARFMSAWSQNKGGFSAVPMRALMSAGLDNALAAGRCISAEGRIIGTFRMMNTCMTLGEAAGLMVSLAAAKATPVQSVSYNALRPRMDAAGFLLP
ncbi:MAG: FAD-dependent oxidoreductase [Clostridia bacterium]